MATIDKPNAAERMIVAAILMLDRGDDPLAIHVVASSALNLLLELIEHGGYDYVSQVLQVGMFTIASARHKGEPVALPTPPAIDALIDDVVAGIDAGEIGVPADLSIVLDASERRKMLGYIIRPFNFLKHAQRDPLATLDEADVDPDGAICHALTAYTMVCPEKPLPEQIKPFLESHGFI